MDIFIKGKNSEIAFENILVLIMVLVLLIISIHKYSKIVRYTKNAAYEKESEEINTALILYRVKYGKFPKNLSVLANSRYIEKYLTDGRIKTIRAKFIENIRTDKEGYPLTPFYKRFIYDRKDGLTLVK